MFAAHILRCLNGSASPQCAGVTCCRKWDFISSVFLCLVWSIQIHEAGLKYNAVSVWRYHKNKKMQQVCLWYSGHIIYTVRYTVYMIICYQRLIYTDIILFTEKARERERTRKNMCLLFAFSWEWSLLAMFFLCPPPFAWIFAAKFLHGKVAWCEDETSWIKKRMLCQDLQTWSQQKTLHLLYIDFSRIWFIIHQHSTKTPSK